MWRGYLNDTKGYLFDWVGIINVGKSEQSLSEKNTITNLLLIIHEICMFI